MQKHETLEAPSVGIIGYGFVGRAMHDLFPGARIYDKYVIHTLPQDREAACTADVVFVCVPTDMAPDGSCDTSVVDSVVQYVSARSVTVMKSTVPPQWYRDNPEAVCNPEFLTERNWKEDIRRETRIILGGDKAKCDAVRRLYRSVYPPEMRYVFTDAVTASLAKYASNAFLATKVAYANALYDIAGSLGVDWDELREIWLTDKRVGRGHTDVTPMRGFGGYCLPKDTAALAAISGSPLLKAVLDYNASIR